MITEHRCGLNGEYSTEPEATEYAWSGQRCQAFMSSGEDLNYRCFRVLNHDECHIHPVGASGKTYAMWYTGSDQL